MVGCTELMAVSWAGDDSWVGFYWADLTFVIEVGEWAADKELGVCGIEGSESDEDDETTPVENNNCKVDKFWSMPPLLKTPVLDIKKKAKIKEGGPNYEMLTQEYVRKITEEPSDDDHFMRGPWLSAVQYLAVEGSIATGCFGDMKTFIKNGKVEKVVAVIKSCTSNILGDLTVTLKDLLGIISGTMHYKVLNDEGYRKAISVGAVLILRNVSVFS
nr:hypothetical protein [Tanacetum cinerariifolium]